MRKSTAILVILFLIAGVTGCSMTVFNTGRDFDTSQIAKIEKGKTTSEELVEMFGEPIMKTVISENKTKWVYNYITSKREGLYSKDANTKQKMLDITLSGNVVIHYKYMAGMYP